VIPNEHEAPDQGPAESSALETPLSFGSVEPPESAEDEDLDLNADANPFSSVNPPAAPRLRPREATPEPEAEEPPEHSWIPDYRQRRSSPFDPRTAVPLPPHGWYAQVPSMEPLPDPNVLPQSAPALDPALAPPLPTPAPPSAAAPSSPPSSAAPRPVTSEPAVSPPPAPPSAEPLPAARNGAWAATARPPATAPPLPQAAPSQSPTPQAELPPVQPAQAPPTQAPLVAAPTMPAPSAASRGYAQQGYPSELHPLRVDERSAGEPPAVVRENADSLTTEALLHGKRVPPGSGWRRTVYQATGGLVRVGESAANLRRRDLVNRARTPVAGGHHRVAVMSLKGGVGKTTTTAGLGATLASLRGDRVIAVDANPDRGTLSDKVRLETSATVRDLLNERDQVSRYADVRAFTSQASSRLEVLASDRDPGVSVAFSAEDYRQVCRMLEHYYSICITDCGTGLLHSAMSGVLQLADHIVLVSSASVDGARSASATLDWLDAHDYGDLVRDAAVVLSAIRPRSKSTVDLDRLEQHFAARCRAVVRIPYDSHLEEGAEVELDQLSAETAEAYLTLAAVVGDGFAVPRRAAIRAQGPA
jgi:MinD-like ATPase involved in chromosome partitioning or flagellar assembly